MGKEILTFGCNENKKHKFYRYKCPIFLEDIDIKNVLVSHNISSGKKNYKYFVDYLYNNYKIKPLHVMLPKIRVDVKS